MLEAVEVFINSEVLRMPKVLNVMSIPEMSSPWLRILEVADVWLIDPFHTNENCDLCCYSRSSLVSVCCHAHAHVT